MKQVRLVGWWCGIDGRQDLREVSTGVFGLEKPHRARAGAEQVHIGRAEQHAFVWFGLLHQQVVFASQDFTYHFQVPTAPENLHRVVDAFRAQAFGKPFELF